MRSRLARLERRRHALALRRRGARRGGILVLVAASMGVLIATAAFVVDMASALASRTHQQAAADAGALAAAHDLLGTPDEAAAKADAVAWVGRNGYTITADDVTIWNHPSGRKAVTVRWTEQTPAYFSRVMGRDALPVFVSSTAVLGQLDQIPNGVLPFAVPAYTDANGDWWVLSSTTPGDYRKMIDDPPTQLILKVDQQANQSGNFLALAIDGPGGNVYRDSIVNGAQTPLQVGDVVPTQTGGLIGPTKQALEDRLARGDAYRTVIVPLISRDEWDAATGKEDVTILGFVVARITQVTQTEIYATFESRTFPGEASLDTNVGAGGYAPLLVDGAP